MIAKLFSDSKTWTKNGSVTDLNCTGEHELTCEYTLKPDYDSDGEYKCKGYNEVRSVKKTMESSAVTLTTGMIFTFIIINI